MLDLRQTCVLKLQIGTNFSTIHPIVSSQNLLRVSRICYNKSDFLKISKKWSHAFWSEDTITILLKMRWKKEREKSLKVVPFVVTYHPKRELINKVILQYFDLVYMARKLKRCLPWNVLLHSEVQES